MDSIKVNVLGTDYDVLMGTLSTDEHYKSCDGYCDWYAKRIHVRKHVREDANRDPMTYDDESMQLHELKNLRHELVHAFLYESGLGYDSNSAGSWATNEEMVDWFAIQMPKIMEAYESVYLRLKKIVDK